MQIYFYIVTDGQTTNKTKERLNAIRGHKINRWLMPTLIASICCQIHTHTQTQYHTSFNPWLLLWLATLANGWFCLTSKAIKWNILNSWNLWPPIIHATYTVSYTYNHMQNTRSHTHVVEEEKLIKCSYCMYKMNMKTWTSIWTTWTSTCIATRIRHLHMLCWRHTHTYIMCSNSGDTIFFPFVYSYRCCFCCYCRCCR